MSGHSFGRGIVLAGLLALVVGLAPAFSMDGVYMSKVEAIAGGLTVYTQHDVKIVVEDSINPDAYIHPLGHIVITTGILDLFNNDSELAFIIGHELAHIVRGHFDDKSDVLGISKDIYLPENIWKEMDADAYSLKIIKAAGYEPAASLRVLNILRTNNLGQSSSLEKRMSVLVSNIGD
ncbi:MAG TPA: hypothetical protein DHU69_08705 [Deltaproteobacteria bacterium]|nr:hypothetical protein [Deltaproteobacteria bacterium]HCY19810.1 hypothetical protein [Deltaproteobacteria bacterium]